MPSNPPIHPALARELRQSKRLLKFFHSLPESSRRHIDDSVREVKKKRRANDAPSTPPNT